MTQISRPFIRLATESRKGTLIGEQTEGVRFLVRNGYSVPTTYVVTTPAYDAYLRDPSSLLDIVREELKARIDPRASYSVRLSSTDAQSVEGQLCKNGVNQILKSIKSIWEAQRGVDPPKTSARAHPGIAVIIQQTVEAKISGLTFTKNPVTGMDEVTIEASEGQRESLPAGKVSIYQGVYKWGQWVKTPNAPEQTVKLLENVARESSSLEKRRGSPLILEWAYDGHALHWLQLREMPSSSGRHIYSNKMAKEFLPGTIKPLVWSVNIPIVCGAWIELISKLVGDLRLTPHQLAKNVYHRAYFNMGIIGEVFAAFGIPREGLEILMGYGTNAPERPSLKPGLRSLKHLPRLLLFALDIAFFERRVNAFIQSIEAELEGILHRPLETLGEADTVATIKKLYRHNRRLAFSVIVSQLLNALYHKLLMNQLEKKGWKFQDLALGSINYRDIDPSWGLQMLRQEFKRLPKRVQRSLRSSLRDAEYLRHNRALASFGRRFEIFMRKFGHLSDQGNDFSRVPWREQPELVLNMVITGSTFQPQPAKRGQDRANKRAGFLLSWVYQKAKRSLEYKERISFNYTKSHSHFRAYFLHLATLLTAAGCLSTAEDIFYFTFDEIQSILKERRLSRGLTERLNNRKREIVESAKLELPEAIYGDEELVPRGKLVETKTLRGIPASGGYYAGSVCVIRSPQDFFKVTKGAVLVIPFSDISWTPVLAQAGAIISESGGILSHSAIVAREHGMPSVVGVKGAGSLRDGDRVHVDGYSGEVTMM